MKNLKNNIKEPEHVTFFLEPSFKDAQATSE